MIASVGIVVMMGIIAVLELPALIKKKWKKELWVFVVLMLIATGLAVAQALKLKIPNPLDLLTWIYRPISDGINHFLK